MENSLSFNSLIHKPKEVEKSIRLEPKILFEETQDSGQLSKEERLDLAEKFLDSNGVGNEEFATLARHFIYTVVVGQFQTNVYYLNSVQDVVQNATKNAVFHLKDFKADVPLRNWLSRIAKNAAIGFIRNTKAGKDLISGSSSVDDLVSQGENVGVIDGELELIPNRELLQKVFSLLNARDQELLNLHYIEGYSYEEMAKKLGKSVPNVKSRIRFIKEKLLKHKEDLGINGDFGGKDKSKK